jgi:DNA helicase IV
LDPANGVRIIDWRVAPVAQIFYRHREGDPYEETFPGRVAEGVVEARRIVVIVDGVLTRIIGDKLALARSRDGRWSRADRGALAFVSGGAGSAARPGSLGVGAGSQKGAADVTALLDAEQFAAVSAPPEEPLLVLGSAGSGKTTVALHRLARIAAREPTATR